MRSLSNPPAYYHGLATKQQRNWRRNTRRIDRNEELRRDYPAFRPSSNVKVIHIHDRTRTDVVDELIRKAKETTLYTLDTESENHGQGALVQIECIHSINYTTVLLIETHYLPDRQSTLFEKIDELCSIILRRDNEIISWGPIESELANFTDFGLFDIGKETRSSNMQSLFRRWYDDTKTHPVTERREPRTGRSTVEIFDTPSDDHERKRTNDHSQRRTRSDDHSSVGTWSLQDAIASTLSLFLDKTETLNRWKCGLDPILNTWQQQRFNRHRVDEEYERTKRARMTTYAINDCVAVTALYFHIHPTRSDELHNEKMRATEFD